MCVCVLLFYNLFLTYLLFFSGTELKNIACCKIGCILALELQRGKEGMQLEKIHWVLLLLVHCD